MHEVVTSFASRGVPEKDRSGALSVPQPGPDLLSEFVQERERPTFRPAFLVAVPQLAYGYDLGSVRPRVALWLSGWQAKRVLHGQLDSLDIGALQKLTAAALRDVGGLSPAAVAEWVEGAAFDADRAAELLDGGEPVWGPSAISGNTDQVKRRAREGRHLWSLLRAWPWWPIAQEATLDGGLPADWHEMPAVVRTYANWR